MKKKQHEHGGRSSKSKDKSRSSCAIRQRAAGFNELNTANKRKNDFIYVVVSFNKVKYIVKTDFTPK